MASRQEMSDAEYARNLHKELNLPTMTDEEYARTQDTSPYSDDASPIADEFLLGQAGYISPEDERLVRSRRKSRIRSPYEGTSDGRIRKKVPYQTATTPKAMLDFDASTPGILEEGSNLLNDEDIAAEMGLYDDLPPLSPKTPAHEKRIRDGAKDLLRSLAEDRDENDSMAIDDPVGLNASEKIILDRLQRCPVPPNLEKLQDGITNSLDRACDHLEGRGRTAGEGEPGPPEVDSAAISGTYRTILNALNDPTPNQPDASARDMSILKGQLGDTGVEGGEEGEIGGVIVNPVSISQDEYDQNDSDWSKSLAGTRVHALWTAEMKRKMFIQAVRQDAKRLMDLQKRLGYGDAHQRLNLEDILETFIRMTIESKRRRYLLPLAFQIRREAERNAAKNDTTDYKPLVRTLVHGYFFPEFYRESSIKEREREMITFKRQYLAQLNSLTELAMASDPNLKKSEYIQKHWRSIMDHAIDENAFREIEADIKEQVLFCAEEILLEGPRWGEEWLEEVDNLVDATIYNAHIPTVTGQRVSIFPEKGPNIGHIVLHLVDEAMDPQGKTSVEEAAAALQAVLDVVPEVFATVPNPALAAAPIAAALQAALAVVQQGPVSYALKEGDVAAALAAVRNIDVIQTIPAEKVATILEGIMDVVRSAPSGGLPINARAALRSITAAIDPAAIPGTEDKETAKEVCEEIARLSAGSAAHGAAIACANIEASLPEGVDMKETVGVMAQAAATGSSSTVADTSFHAALAVVAESASEGGQPIQPQDLANTVVEAAQLAQPAAAANAQNMATHAAEKIIEHAHAVAKAGFHLVNPRDLNELPAEVQEALRKTALRFIYLGRNERPDSIVQALMKELCREHGLMYMERLYKKIYDTLQTEEDKFHHGIAHVLVSFHRFMMLRKKKRLPKRTFDTFDEIPLNENRMEIDKLIRAMVVASQRQEKGDVIVEKLLTDTYSLGGTRAIEHLMMGLAWKQNLKLIIPNIYNTMRKVHDFILLK